MKKRSIPAVILLSLITIGIYSLYWLIATRRELITRGGKIPSIYLLFSPFILLLGVAILQLIALLVLSTHMSADTISTPTGSGLFEALTIGLGVLIAITAIPITIYWIYRYCQAAEAVTKGRVSAGLSFTICIILNMAGLGFVWQAVLQDSYNKTA
jgi:hypothetical protein